MNLKSFLLVSVCVSISLAFCQEEERNAFDFLSSESFIRQECLNDKSNPFCNIIAALLCENYYRGVATRYLSENANDIVQIHHDLITNNKPRLSAADKQKNTELFKAFIHANASCLILKEKGFKELLDDHALNIIKQSPHFNGTNEELLHQINLLKQGKKNAYAGNLPE